MWAISFDMDTNKLKKHYPGQSYNQAYQDIRTIMRQKGFTWKQGSVYFGQSHVTAVTCVLVAQELASRYSWFKRCVRDIRMLKIEDNDDLLPAIRPDEDEEDLDDELEVDE